jgi:hypothetical protein
MAQLVRCYFREQGFTAADVSFQAGTAFEFALDVEFTQAEIDIGGQFRVYVRVKNFDTNVVITPAPVTTAPANGVASTVAAPRNQTFAYTVPNNAAAVGQFLDAKAALVVGAAGQDADIGEASCVIIP